MPKGPLGFPRLTDLGPLVEPDPEDWILNESLYEEIRFKLIQSTGYKAIGSDDYDETNLPGRPSRRRMQITISGKDEPGSQDNMAINDAGVPILGTTLMVSCEEDVGEYPDCFHRLVMVDSPEMRKKAKEVGGEIGGVRFGPPHFDTRTNMVAAHFNAQELKSQDQIEATVDKVLELFKQSVDHPDV